MQVIIKRNSNKRGSGFSQVQVTERREIIYLLCLPVIFFVAILILFSEKEEEKEKKKKIKT